VRAIDAGEIVAITTNESPLPFAAPPPGMGDGGREGEGPPPAAPPPKRHGGRAGNRLHLAQVVLAAGFPADAVRAAYEALGAAIAALLPAPPSGGHVGLVAAIYRELIPGGRLPHGAHAALAQLHDLASLDAHGIEVDDALARASVDEAARWVERLDAAVPAP
jgi:hypothetical protein